MKNKLIIPIHSFVDVITNSSTELFVIDKDKGLEMVKEIVDEAIKKYPSPYGSGSPCVFIENPYCYIGLEFSDSETENALKHLRLKGYKIEAPKEEKTPEAIIISWERGEMSQEFIEYISETFGVELNDY